MTLSFLCMMSAAGNSSWHVVSMAPEDVFVFERRYEQDDFWIGVPPFDPRKVIGRLTCTANPKMYPSLQERSK